MSDDLRPEYDLSKLKGGVRGKYAKRFQQGTNLVLLSSHGHGVVPMQVLLQPIGDTKAGILQNLYDKAISEATELFIISAYLTEWRPKQSISNNCQQLSFIVGTDFGITRKAACRSVLRWIPKQFQSEFLAADHISGFHPKLVMWKDENGNCQIVLGSSNLTQAAFTKNYEANVFTPLSDREYDTIKAWVYKIKLECSPISEDWLEQYKENIQQTKAHGERKPPVKPLPVPSGVDIVQAILERRKQHRAFQEISDELAGLIRQCAKGQINNDEFYEKMMQLWGRKLLGRSYKYRLQGKGFEIRGKSGNWQDVCKSILDILDASPSLATATLDDLVRKEIDRLAKADNPNRGAWMSEMLCQYLPKSYPVENKPVKIWLQHIKYRPPRKASEGAKYIDLARKLRLTVKQNKNKVRNLLELDHVIWKWYDNNHRNPVSYSTS